MDGDGQNDPADIPAMLAKLDRGHDLVCGWRFQRHDPFLSRRLPSMIANSADFLDDASQAARLRLHVEGDAQRRGRSI